MSRQTDLLTDTLKGYLRDREMLLVLDNCEQVTPAAPQVASLLKASSHLKVLATSRTALRIYGEREYRVPPLSLPDRKLLQGKKRDNHLPPEEQVARYTQY